MFNCSSEEYHIGLDDFSRSHKIGYEINFLDDAKPALFEKFKTKKFGVIDAMYKRYKKEALYESNDALFGRPSRNLNILSERYKNLFTKGIFPKQITKGSETWRKNQEQESF